MTIRDRIRKWLGIPTPEHMTELLTKVWGPLSDNVRQRLQQQIDGLSYWLEATSKGLREKVDSASSKADAAAKKIGSCNADRKSVV